MNNTADNIHFFDSHAHLDDERFSSDRDSLIAAMQAQGIDFFINVGESTKTSAASIELAKRYDFVYAAAGIHPHHADSVTEDDFAVIKEYATKKEVIAVGEIGLDYFYDNSSRENQRIVFSKQLEIAKNVNLPVIIHNRDSEDDCLAILQEISPHNVKGVIHCFSGSLDFAISCMNLGFYISFAGQITFPKAGELREVVKDIPLDRMLIETDSPYLAPQPKRGKRNQPSYVRYTAEKIAELKGVSLEEVAAATTKNTIELFALSK